MWFGFNDETKKLTEYRGDRISDLYRLNIPDYNRETQLASVEALFYDRDSDRKDHRPDLRSESSQGMSDREDHRPDLRSESSTSQGMSTFMQIYAVAQSMVDRCKDWLSPDRFVCVFSYCTYGAYLNFLSA